MDIIGNVNNILHIILRNYILIHIMLHQLLVDLSINFDKVNRNGGAAIMEK